VALKAKRHRRARRDGRSLAVFPRSRSMDTVVASPSGSLVTSAVSSRRTARVVGPIVLRLGFHSLSWRVRISCSRRKAEFLPHSDQNLAIPPVVSKLPGITCGARLSASNDAGRGVRRRPSGWRCRCLGGHSRAGAPADRVSCGVRPAGLSYLTFFRKLGDATTGAVWNTISVAPDSSPVRARREQFGKPPESSHRHTNHGTMLTNSTMMACVSIAHLPSRVFDELCHQGQGRTGWERGDNTVAIAVVCHHGHGIAASNPYRIHPPPQWIPDGRTEVRHVIPFIPRYTGYFRGMCRSRATEQVAIDAPSPLSRSKGCSSRRSGVRNRSERFADVLGCSPGGRDR
jgi:hypothetical protein